MNNFESKNTFQKTKIAPTPIRSGNSAFHFIIFLSPVPPHDAIIIFIFFPRGNVKVRVRTNAKGGALFEWYRLTSSSHSILFVYFYCSEPIISSYWIIFSHYHCETSIYAFSANMFHTMVGACIIFIDAITYVFGFYSLPTLFRKFRFSVKLLIKFFWMENICHTIQAKNPTVQLAIDGALFKCIECEQYFAYTSLINSFIVI